MILGIAGILLLGVVIFLAVTVFPKFQTAKEITNALQPVLEAENQSMNLDITADLNGELFALDSDIYSVKDKDTKYLILELEGHPLYIVENVLFLENGKAFKIADEMQSQVEEYENLLPQIMAVYEIFEVTKTKTDIETSYEVTVTGEQVENLLEAAMLTEYTELQAIESLQVKLVTKEEQLDRVELSGNANVESTSVQMAVTISEFQILQAGEYVIPDLITESVQTVDKDSLFNLTKDLYRLMMALEPFSDMDKINGTVALTVDCGLIQMDTEMNLSDLKTENTEITNAVDVKQLPEMIALLCLEGDISCTEDGDAYVYKLVLDADFMERLAETIAPELVNYVISFTEGSAELTLEGEGITSMKIVVKGNVNVLFTEIPMEVGAEFIFE